jgi:hypothetical protein
VNRWFFPGCDSAVLSVSIFIGPIFNGHVKLGVEVPLGMTVEVIEEDL